MMNRRSLVRVVPPAIAVAVIEMRGVGVARADTAATDVTQIAAPVDDGGRCPDGADVCIERQSACTDIAWHGMRWCSRPPLIYEGGTNPEVLPVVQVKYNENAILDGRFVRFRLCEDISGGPDICATWWAAKMDDPVWAGIWRQFSPARSTDLCSYPASSIGRRYYTQARGRDGSTVSTLKTESGDAPVEPDYTLLYCGQ